MIPKGKYISQKVSRWKIQYSQGYVTKSKSEKVSGGKISQFSREDKRPHVIKGKKVIC